MKKLTPEQSYSAQIDLAHRKKYAQFFTPEPIAELMTDWLLKNPQLQTVCEPALGLGVFSRALLNHNKQLCIDGFDTDPAIFAHAQALFADHKNVHLHCADYMTSNWQTRYDGIICNPPYFKFHDYDNKTVLRDCQRELGVKLSGFSNLYTLFLVKSLAQLNTNGRAAYLVPSEFLNADYGKAIKAYLLKNRALRQVIVIDFSATVFADALTTACLLLFANDGNDAAVQFRQLRPAADLSDFSTSIAQTPAQSVKFSEIDPARKWRAYYQTCNADSYQRLAPFAHYGKVVRGIATGANDYFVFNQSKATDWAIDTRYLLPCVCRAADAQQPFFTTDDYADLQTRNKASALLRVVPPLNDAVQNYLAHGEGQSIHQRFLTSHRTPWYALENRPPAPIWLTVFNRTGLRFIRNEAGVANLTSFHCLYPTALGAAKLDVLFAYLLTDIARDLFTDHSREYGNGLQKFEPNDINGAMMLDLSKLDAASEQKILHGYVQYRNSVLVKNGDVACLAQINEIFLSLSSS